MITGDQVLTACDVASLVIVSKPTSILSPGRNGEGYEWVSPDEKIGFPSENQETPKLFLVPCWSNLLKNQTALKPLNLSPSPTVGAFVERCKSTKGIAVTVVDANAIIDGGERLSQCADKFVSIPEVMDTLLYLDTLVERAQEWMRCSSYYIDLGNWK
ncbi:hypothetical protein L484_017190 [Morus notabilis]|uniref:Uncharacterized protein n=1 Tax=Morus notabilis TaxID=981085 RepID=W9QVQ7_9ROSA|nr:hypothetical protein L484_017190 [Morus notabilis]